MVRDRQFFFNIWLANVLRATMACNFFDILTSKSGPRMVFCVFDLKMCFAPQRRAMFPHPNFKKVVWDRQFFNVLTWECASRHSGVQFFRHPNFKKWSETVSFLTFWLAKVLRATTACNFSTSQLPKAFGTTQRFATFLTFRATVSSFHWLYFLLTLLSSDSASLLCFSSFHIVGN